ncbi:MAG: adenosine deaminase [Myxococcales bacterium]|nr:adenosine deaminase [Myxococcota bacterium]MDW8282748.1 adenosine deaminase [Myxococcales bacterium]
MALTLEFIEKLPKTDLHCHLDGSLRLRTILELAEQQKVKLPADDEEGLFRHVYAGNVARSLEEYLKAFDITLAVLQTEEALYRAAYELAEDCARENVRYLEVRYSPMLHQMRGLPLTAIVEAVIQGLRAAERRFGIRTGVILCGIRTSSAEASLRMAELCVAFKNRGVVAFDLAGAELNHPAKEHKRAFQLILDNNVNCTAHAGEAYGPESIAQAIHYCGAHRIGHGTRLWENGDLLNYACDHRIPLEICVSSNIQTGAATDIASHPLPFYYNYGLRVTINTDNRLITNTTVSKELYLCHQHYGFTLDDIKEVIIAGFKSAFLPHREKSDLIKQVKRELDSFVEPGTEPAPGSQQGSTQPPVYGSSAAREP